MKRIIALAIALALTLSFALAEEAAPPITEGIFQYTLVAEGYGTFENYIHFYPNGVFYASFLGGGQYAAGYYEIKDEAFEYTDKEGGAATVPQTVRLTLADGSVYEVFGYDAENGTIAPVAHIYDNTLAQDKASAHTPQDETGVALTEFALDEYSLVSFMHNGTFQDTISAFIEGVWVRDGDIYTLTDADSGASYTITVSGDTAAYAGLDGTEETLALVKAAEAQLVFAGSAAGAYGELAVTISCLDNGTAVLNLKYAGQDNSTNGTWTLAADYSNATVSLDSGVEFTAMLDAATQSFSGEIMQSDGTQDVPVTLSTAQ
jgi:hypothetical protein